MVESERRVGEAARAARAEVRPFLDGYPFDRGAFNGIASLSVTHFPSSGTPRALCCMPQAEARAEEALRWGADAAGLCSCRLMQLKIP